MVKERQRAYRGEYAKKNVIGACLCVLSPVPLFVGIIRAQKEFFIVLMPCATLLLAGIDAAIFVVAGVRWSSIQKLLKEGEFFPEEKRKSRVRGAVAAVYWLAAITVYLAWSFLGRDDWLCSRGSSDFAWKSSWIVWQVAGVLFAAVMCL